MQLGITEDKMPVAEWARTKKYPSLQFACADIVLKLAHGF